MKHLLIAAVLAAGTGGMAQAGAIERACITSDRPASRALCDCIQRVADRTLSFNDQRLAARFFKDPHMSQEIRQSDRSSHEVFWERYKTFGRTAASYCS